MPTKRQKGQEFEREVAKRLSLWLTSGERDDLFWRSAMSGGRATLQSRRGAAIHRRRASPNKAQLGDLSAIDPLGEELLLRHVIVECKFREDVEFVAGFLKGTGRLLSWWNKEVEKAEATKSRDPFMVVRENRQPTVLLTTARAADALGIVGPIMTLNLWPMDPFVFLFDEIIPTVKAWKKR